MAVILLDLGNTLLDDQDHPLPGAVDLLTALRHTRDADGKPLKFGLISDWEMSDDLAERPALTKKYYAILKTAGIDHFFTPLERHVTLSTEVGVFKPDPRIFQTAVYKLDPGASTHHALFVTENADHVKAARQQGMMAIHFKGPGEPTGEIGHLADLLPIVSRLVKYAPCCKKHGEAVGLHASAANKSKKLDAATKALADAVSPARLKSRIGKLVDFGTRWTYSNKVTPVTDWINDQFLAQGYAADKVRFQKFTVPGGSAQPQRNVLCGAGKDDPGLVLICAHYDSLSETPAQVAPGADDNASGIALLLEASELLRQTPLRRGVLFAAFGGEEQGLFGSAECATIAAQEHWNIDVVINLDMVAYQDPAKRRHIVVEYDQGNRNPGNDAAAKAFGLQMAQVAADYTNLVVEHTDIWNSDYIPFEEKGYACIGLYEASQNPGYHKTSDVLASLDMNHLAEIAKLLVATVFQIAR
jgi:FMN phosphatase YigB (HAD superfamily)